MLHAKTLNFTWYSMCMLGSISQSACRGYSSLLLLECRKKKKMSPPYRVMLHNDNFNKREYVVQVLMKAIPGMTVDIAVNVMNEAHINGLAVVIVCPQEDAEDYCMQLRTNGLLSSIEPASC